MQLDFKMPKDVKWKPLKKRKYKHVGECVSYRYEVFCVCICGKKRWIPIQNLKQRKSRQCQSCALTTHGRSDTRLHIIWRGMKQRCFNLKATSYKHYGQRGIIVCKQWKTNFIVFRKWARKNGYNKNLTIERINVNGPYSPKNCTWIPKSEQSNNTQRTRYLNDKTFLQWSKELNLNPSLLRSRSRREGLTKNILRPVRKESSKFPGVSFDCSQVHKPWQARFGKNGKVYRIGRFKTEKEAYTAYKIAKGTAPIGDGPIPLIQI